MASPATGSFPILADQDLSPIEILPITPRTQLSLMVLASQPASAAGPFLQTSCSRGCRIEGRCKSGTFQLTVLFMASIASCAATASVNSTMPHPFERPDGSCRMTAWVNIIVAFLGKAPVTVTLHHSSSKDSQS